MPLNRPECRPQKFVMVTQVAAGRLVPPFNPRASRCHPPIHQPACQDGATRQFVSGRVRREVQTSATRQPETVPPVSSERREERKASTRWCHPPVQRAGWCRAGWCPPSIRPTARMVPLVNSERRQPGATPQLGMANWCHPPVRKCKLGATPQSGGRKWRHRSGPLRPELLPFARSDRFQFVTQRRGLCSLVTLNGKLLA